MPPPPVRRACRHPGPVEEAPGLGRSHQRAALFLDDPRARELRVEDRELVGLILELVTGREALREQIAEAVDAQLRGGDLVLERCDVGLDRPQFGLRDDQRVVPLGLLGREFRLLLP